MERHTLILIVGVFAVFMSAATIILGIYLYRNVFNAEGKGAAKETGKLLRRYSLLRRFRILEHLEFGQKGKTAAVGHLVLGPFGILLVDTMGVRGEYYGQPDEATWAVLSNGRRIIIENPLLRQQEAMRAIREQLAAHHIYKVSMEQVVYFSSPSKKNQVYVNDDRLMLSGKLGGYLDRTRFKQQAGIDVGKITDILSLFTGR